MFPYVDAINGTDCVARAEDRNQAPIGLEAIARVRLKTDIRNESTHVALFKTFISSCVRGTSTSRLLSATPDVLICSTLSVSTSLDVRSMSGRCSIANRFGVEVH